VIEASGDNGGISKTVNHNGNRIDIGGHRFFSKSDRVMAWWLDILPIEASAAEAAKIEISYHNKRHVVVPKESGRSSRSDDDVMLVRSRVSRIYFGGNFYDYPISLSLQTISNLGILRTIKIGLSYARASLFPIKEETSLEQFLINRFGRELYTTFFRDYTEKVWGVPCTEITAEWGAQRIKGLSITRAVVHAIKRILTRTKSISQKQTETSLIELFLYPKLGPGQMWDCVARDVSALGGKILYLNRVDRIHIADDRVNTVGFTDIKSGERHSISCDYCFSTMPIQDLVKSITPGVPTRVREVSDGLVYRDFITVGLLLEKLKVQPGGGSENQLIPDNWIYIQEPNVKLGRLQIFNNWSPAMVADTGKVWIGLEYFCNEGDVFWSMSDEQIIALAIEEIASINIIYTEDVLDSVLIRMPKAYPAYFGTYEQLPVVREHLDRIENLFLNGRNGMHKYNNQDHSMLSAMVSVENIISGRTEKDNIWQINTEEEYHESKS
jgi:protoporphyrinogen oxidase